MDSQEDISDLERASLSDIREWIKSTPYLPQEIPDDLLNMFLHSCYYKLERTQKTIATYFKIKSSTPEFFNDRSIKSPDLAHIVNAIKIFSLPGRTKDGNTVIVGMLAKNDYTQFYLDYSIKLLFMVIDSCLKECPDIPGFLFLFDMSGIGFGHLTRVSISSVRKYFHYIQDAMPVRLKGIHIINVNPVMSHIMTLIRPFTYKEHMKQIHLYRPIETENMYSVIPREILPKDHNGEAASVDTLFKDTVDRLKELDQYFLDDESLRIDESKREKDPYEAGMIRGFFSRWTST